MLDRFEGLDAQVVGVSVDHVPCLAAWAEALGGMDFPLLSDFWPHGRVAESYGILREEGFSERALFLIDKEGFVRYVDVHDIDDQPDNDVLFAELAKLEPAKAGALIAGEEESPGAQSTGAVVMYCRSWCPDCRRARAWLDEQGIAYVEVDVDDDPDARTRAAAHNEGRLHTPTFEIGEGVCVDFRPDTIIELLGL